LDSLQSVSLDWAYRAAKDGKIMISITNLQEFLNVFEATLGFFGLTINKVKRYFFVYIANGLEPQNIKYLKPLRESPKPTEIRITTASNKEWKHMFMYRQLTGIPFLGLDKFGFPFPTAFEPPPISKKETDETGKGMDTTIKKTLGQ
jgi:hypothetical protein